MRVSGGEPARGGHSLRGLLRGFAVLASGTVASQAVSFAVLAVVTRRIGPSSLGDYQFALSLAQYFAIPVNFGVTVLAIRDVVREPERAREITGEVVTLLFGVSLVCYAALVVLAPVLATTDGVEALLPITGLTFVIGALTLDWMLQAERRLGLLGGLRLGAAVAGGIVAVATVASGPDGATAYAWSYVAALAVLAVGAGVGTVRSPGWPRRIARLRMLSRRLVRSLPFGASLVLIQVYYSLDSIMLGYLGTSADVGQYAVAYRIPLAIAGLAGVWVQALYPHAAGLAVEAPERLGTQVSRVASLSILLAVPLAIGGVLVADELMPAAFGSDFAAASTPFALLICSSALIIVSVNFGNVLLACGDERFYAAGVGAGAALNVGLNFALIPSLGTTGAGIATVAAEALVFVVMAVRFGRRVAPVRLEWGRLARGLVAAALLALTLLLLRDENVWIAIAAGVAVWAAAALAVRAVRPSEIGRLRAEPAP